MKKTILFMLLVNSITVICAPETKSSYQTVAQRDISGASPARPARANVYTVEFLSPYHRHEAVTKTYSGTDRTITDYAIRNNDLDLMRLLAVSRNQTVKPAQDTAALKRLAIEQTQENLPSPNYYAVINKPEKTQVVLEQKPVEDETLTAVEID